MSQTVVYVCQQWQGTSTVNMARSETREVTIIPENVEGLNISLSSNVDLDLQLYDGVDDSGDCFVGYECAPNDWQVGDARATQPFTYGSMTMTFSGDDRGENSAIVTETITIDKTDRPLALYVTAYGNGNGLT
eukprot:UN05286